MFVTENYVRKVDSGNVKDYCLREFNYGFDKLGGKRMILVVFDASMTDRKNWGGMIRFLLGEVLFVDLSEIFSSSASEQIINQEIDKLFERITRLEEDR